METTTEVVIPPMDAEEFEAALFALGEGYERVPLTVLGPAVGRTPRTLSRYLHEGLPVDPPVAKLVRMFVAHGEVF